MAKERSSGDSTKLLEAEMNGSDGSDVNESGGDSTKLPEAEMKDSDGSDVNKSSGDSTKLPEAEMKGSDGSDVNKSSGDSTKLPEAEMKDSDGNDVNKSVGDSTKLLEAEMKDSDGNDVANTEMDVKVVGENGKILTSTDSASKEKSLTDENELKKRKRGKRGGKRRGGKDATILTDLPDGILLVEDGDYVGYHCIYCNCVLASLTTVSAHVAGFRHQLITENKGQLGEGKKNEETTVQSESEKLENVGEQENISESSPPNVEVSLPLKSCLEDDLATIAEPVIGLDYVTEKRVGNKEPSFECDLCAFTSNADDMKVHILGTRHRLMYLKTKDPQKIAELMTKNLQRTERNKEIKEYSEVLMNQQGRGTIVVEISESVTEEGQTDPFKKPKKMSGAAIRRRRRREGKRNATKQGSSQQVSQKKANQGTFDKKKKGTSNKKKKSTFFEKNKQGIAGQKRKSPYDEAYSSKRKRQRSRLQRGSIMQNARETFFDNNQYPLADQYYQPQPYAYCGQPYQTDRVEERFSYGNDYLHDSPSNQTREYQNVPDPVKLHDIDVTNEEEAGVVMNVINSLTERFLKYKLKNIAGPAKEVIIKSLGDQLKKKEKKTRRQNKNKNKKAAAQRRQKLNKKSVGNQVAKVHPNWNNERNDIPTRGVSDQPQRGWDQSRDTAYPRERMNQPRSDWDGSRDTHPRDRRNQPQSNFNETRNEQPRDVIDHRRNQPQSNFNETRNEQPRDVIDHRRNQPQSNFNETRNERPRDVIDHTQHDWHMGRSFDQPQRPWNETRDATSNKDRMDQPRDWSETRDSTYRRDVVSQPQRDWNEGKDTTYARNRASQPQRDWNEDKDAIYARNRASQPQRDWDNVRDPRSREVMNHPRYDWNENRNVGTMKNEKSIEQSQYSWGETTRALEANENVNSFSQFPQRQTPFTGKANIDSFSHHRQSEAQHTLPKTDSFPMNSQNSRYFGQTSMGWNEKSSSSQLRSTPDSFTTRPSYPQGSTSSLPIKRNIDHPTFVDDMFDDYQKKMKGESSRSTITNMNSGNSNYPTLTTRTLQQQVGPPTHLSYNRPPTFGQLSSASFSNWK